MSKTGLIGLVLIRIFTISFVMFIASDIIGLIDLIRWETGDFIDDPELLVPSDDQEDILVSTIVESSFNDALYVNNEQFDELDTYLSKLYDFDYLANGIIVGYEDEGNYFDLDYRPYSNFNPENYEGQEQLSHILTPEKIVEADVLHYNLVDEMSYHLRLLLEIERLTEVTSCSNFQENVVFSCSRNEYHKIVYNEDSLYWQNRIYGFSGNTLSSITVLIYKVTYVGLMPSYEILEVDIIPDTSREIRYLTFDENEVLKIYQATEDMYRNSMMLYEANAQENTLESITASTSNLLDIEYRHIDGETDYRFSGNQMYDEVDLYLYHEGRFQVGLDDGSHKYMMNGSRLLFGIESLSGWDEVWQYEIRNEGSPIQLLVGQALYYHIGNPAYGLVIEDYSNRSMDENRFEIVNSGLSQSYISYDDFFTLFDAQKQYNDFITEDQNILHNGTVYSLQEGIYDQILLLVPMWMIEQVDDAVSDADDFM